MMSVYISNSKLWNDFYNQNNMTNTQTGRGKKDKNKSMMTIYHDITTMPSSGITPPNVISPIQQLNQQATSQFKREIKEHNPHVNFKKKSKSKRKAAIKKKVVKRATLTRRGKQQNIDFVNSVFNRKKHVVPK